MIELTRTNGQRPVDRLSDIDKHIHVWETFVGERWTGYRIAVTLVKQSLEVGERGT